MVKSEITFALHAFFLFFICYKRNTYNPSNYYIYGTYIYLFILTLDIIILPGQGMFLRKEFAEPIEAEGGSWKPGKPSAVFKARKANVGYKERALLCS